MIRFDKLQTVAAQKPAAIAADPLSPRSRETMSNGDLAMAQERFLVRLAESLHRYGTPSHELEEILQSCADALGLNAAFFSTPTAIFISFPESAENRTVLRRVSPGEIDLEKLVGVDRIVSRFLRGELSIESATRELEKLDERKGSFPTWMYVLSFGIASGSVVSFFQGGPREILVTSMIGLLVGALEQVARWNADFARAYCAIASTIAAFLAVMASKFWPGLSAEIVTLGSLIVLVPGLTITMAVSELARQQLASGTSRFMGALFLFFILGFGVAFGRGLATTIFQPVQADPDAANRVVFWICLLIAPFSFAVLFRTRRKDVLIVFVTCLVGFGCGRLGDYLLGSQLGPALGSFSVAVFSNLVSRWLKQPAALTLVPGLMFLVPGSIGFLSFQAMLGENTIAGIQLAFRVLFVAAALVSGLLMANLLVRPRRFVNPS